MQAAHRLFDFDLDGYLQPKRLLFASAYIQNWMCNKYSSGPILDFERLVADDLERRVSMKDLITTVTQGMSWRYIKKNGRGAMFRWLDPQCKHYFPRFLGFCDGQEYACH